jgi:EAL domain-containing protein (putative c-di-GMP-specific phosphodiesterase class I)
MARLLAADLVAAIDEPIVIEGIAVRIAASIGIATLPGGVDRAELIRMADVAMYDAKRNDRTIGEYSPHLDPNGRERLALLASLGAAIEDRAFTLHYQPVIEAASGRVVGMEALVRWEHPELGLLYPDDFIPLAEQSGLISRITRAVIDQSVGFLATVRTEGFDIGLSINLSGKDLVDEGMPQHVMAAVARHRVPRRKITMEITETAVASDLERSSRTLQALQAAGLRVSIDDFGVGSSSLSQLIAMPVDELKLDRSFVAALDSDRRAEAILRSTVELGRTLGLAVVAEGVETTSSLAVVRQHGVTLLQGFLLTPPLPPRDLLGFLSRAAAGAEVLSSERAAAPVAESATSDR